ncbi:MAG: hypothetical protein QX198_13025 [Methylococcaceae bacterium]
MIAAMLPPVSEVHSLSRLTGAANWAALLAGFRLSVSGNPARTFAVPSVGAVLA